MSSGAIATSKRLMQANLKGAQLVRTSDSVEGAHKLGGFAVREIRRGRFERGKTRVILLTQRRYSWSRLGGSNFTRWYTRLCEG